MGVGDVVQFIDELLDACELRLKQSEEQLAIARSRVKDLEAMVETDPLLNIPNRRGFERVLTRGLAYVKRHHTSAALVFIDLDRFKSINDRYGHLAGDHALKTVAAVISQHVRGSDIVGRFGGDEFTALLWNLSERDARTKALAFEDIIAGLGIEYGPEVLSIGASAGVAMLGLSDTLDELLGRADTDMYARKQQRVDPSRQRTSAAFSLVAA